MLPARPFSLNLRAFAALAGASMLAAASLASAATITPPYFNDFSNNAADFTPTGASWSVSGGAYNVSIPDNTTTSSTVFASTLGAANPKVAFSETAVFTADASVANKGTAVLGLSALGTAADAATNATIYLADVTGVGAMRIVRVNAGAGATATTGTFTGGLVSGRVYTQTLAGTYNGSGGLTLTFTLTDNVSPTPNTTTVTHTLDASPLTGSNFGLRDRNTSAAGSGTPVTIAYDSYTLVPEPASIGLLVLGGVALCRRRPRYV